MIFIKHTPQKEYLISVDALVFTGATKTSVTLAVSGFELIVVPNSAGFLLYFIIS